MGRSRPKTIQGMFPKKSGAAIWVASISPAKVPITNQKAELKKQLRRSVWFILKKLQDTSLTRHS